MSTTIRTNWQGAAAVAADLIASREDNDTDTIRIIIGRYSDKVLIRFTRQQAKRLQAHDLQARYGFSASEALREKRPDV